MNSPLSFIVVVKPYPTTSFAVDVVVAAAAVFLFVFSHLLFFSFFFFSPFVCLFLLFLFVCFFVFCLLVVAVVGEDQASAVTPEKLSRLQRLSRPRPLSTRLRRDPLVSANYPGQGRGIAVKKGKGAPCETLSLSLSLSLPPSLSPLSLSFLLSLPPPLSPPLSLFLSLFLSLCPSLSLSVCLSICLSVSLSLEILNLPQQLDYNKGIFMHKVLNNSSPNYLA